MSQRTDSDTQMQEDKTTARGVSLVELEPAGKGPRKLDGRLALVAGVKVVVEVVVGSAEMCVDELFALQDGSVVQLDQLHDAPLSIRLDGKTIAEGSLVVVGDNFGIRVGRVLDAPAVDEA